MSDRDVVRSQVTDLVAGTRSRAVMVARWTALLWMIECVDWLMPLTLDQYGIRPREISGLWGILFAPFLHGGFGHLIANTLPFILLGFLTSARKRADFYAVAVGSALIGGLGTWLIGGAGTVHIGASGVVFGMLGFLMGRGIFERSISSIALSAAVTAAFGGMLWGVLPTVGAGISWEGHLFGFIGGMLISRFLGNRLREQRGG